MTVPAGHTSPATPPARLPRSRSASRRHPARSLRRPAICPEQRRSEPTSPSPARPAEALMLRQLAATVRAVMEMHEAVGDAQRAAQLDRALREQYTSVRDRLPAIPKTGAASQSAAMPGAADGLDPELARVVEVAQRGQVIPATGSPLPNPIEKQRPRTTATPIERDGHER